jgi:CMP-N-acetylneuraminic acid synthetase
MIIGIIPARGGSKGIKNKNIRMLLGKPLIAHSIECGLSCPSIDHLIVSTDNEKIAEISRDFGAEVPFMRPSVLGGDHTPMMEVLKHALDLCEKIYERRISAMVLLDATSPLRTVDDVENCIRIFKEEDCEAVISAVPAKRNPYFNMVVEENGFLRLVLMSEIPITRRQDCPPVYDLNNSIWVFSREVILKKMERLPEKSRIYVMDEASSVDVDREIDFKILEILMGDRNV